jgi:hypothetical protein
MTDRGRMRYRDRWERWLRKEIQWVPLPKGVDAITVWAVATMLSSYADSDGSHIEVSMETLRRQLRIGKPKLDRTVQWLKRLRLGPSRWVVAVGSDVAAG